VELQDSPTDDETTHHSRTHHSCTHHSRTHHSRTKSRQRSRGGRKGTKSGKHRQQLQDTDIEGTIALNECFVLFYTRKYRIVDNIQLVTTFTSNFDLVSIDSFSVS